MTSPADNELTSTLTREAERFTSSHGADLSMDRVLDRAGEIRRGRRMRASLVMAAVVLAVAVPVGIAVTNTEGPANPNPPAPAANNDPLTIDGVRSGKAPRNGYAQAGTLHLGDSEIPLGKGGEPRYLARYDGGFLVGRSDADGNTTVSTYADVKDTGDGTSSFNSTGSEGWTTDGGFAVSPKGQVVAFVRSDGTVIAIEDHGDASNEVGKIPTGSGFEAVAVVGEKCAEALKADACTIYVTSRGETPANWAVTPGQEPVLVRPGLHNLTDVAPGDLASGITEAHEDLSTCSGVLDNADVQLWNTCTATNKAGRRVSTFSPDGKHLLATGSVGSGMGDSELAILNAKTGKVVVDLSTVTDAVIVTMLWEDDEDVLAVVAEKGSFAVLRIDLNGDRELALSPETGIDDVTSPYLLPQT